MVTSYNYGHMGRDAVWSRR